MPDRPRTRRVIVAASSMTCLLVALAASLSLNAAPHPQDAPEPTDGLKDLQNSYVDAKAEKMTRAYHFGSQGPADVFSNHTSHSNRLVPVYTFGRKADLNGITGANSPYRDPERVKTLYGRIPENTVNPEAEYGDQADLYRLQAQAVAEGARHLFIVWFDGMDWDTNRAAAIARTGEVYHEGKGAGLIFQDHDADGTAQYGYVVTSPTHDDPADQNVNVDTQSLDGFEGRMVGGYDARIAGPNPWTRGPQWADGYIKGQSANNDDRHGVEEVGGILHAYTDSSCSAGEFATGIKSYNSGVNVTDDGRFSPTLFNQLQQRGWKVGTVSSVPFNHASPAAMYAHNVSRDDYQDLAREMLGLESVVQRNHKLPRLPGLDVVIGTGWGQTADAERLQRTQGTNAVAGNTYITADDLKAIDLAFGGRYLVAQREAGVEGSKQLQHVADLAAQGRHRLFGFYGTASGHLPYRTADGRYDPSKGIKGVAERYQPEDLVENPSLADMTRAALTVLSADQESPFALFVEAGDTDWALHDNNLDTTIGTIYDGEDAIRVILDWVARNSNWDDSVMIVTADHGHYLVLDDPEAIAGLAKPAPGTAEATD